MRNTQSTSMPYDWLKQIPTSLLQLDEIPLLGFPPSFPWNEFSKAIRELFEIPDFNLEAEPFEWIPKEKLLENMGTEIMPLFFTIPSLEGNLCFVLAKADVHRLMSLMLNDMGHEQDLLDDDFLQGFYDFAAYEVLHLLTKLPYDNSISPQIQKNGTLPHEASLCSNIKIHLRNKTLTGCILISPALRRSWKEKYAERSLELPLHDAIAEKLTLPIHLEVGRTSLTLSEWKTVKRGDFVLLDSCTVKLDDEKGGRVTLTVNGVPFYIGKIKDGNIKILDHPLYYPKEATTMNLFPHDETSDEESSMDFDLESFDSELESAHEMESEHETAHGSEESEHTSTELTEESQASSHEQTVSENEKQEETKGLPEEDTTQTIPTESALNIEEVPLSIVIEVGRLEMSVKKILELQPGNLLELDVHPENGVDLIVNGKRLAKGELVKLGEALGVRILDIG